MDWRRDLPTWPNAELSRLVPQRPHRWHVQEAGSGPTLLLLHGAGGATHSWRDILPDLAGDFHVIAIDLPGQGFTKLGVRQRCGLDHMAEDIASLCKAQGWQPSAIIGHCPAPVPTCALATGSTACRDWVERCLGQF